MHRPAETAFPVHDLIRDRWSPRAFADRAVPRDAVAALLEAARWAASSYNEQPWAYLLATRDDPAGLERMQGCLNEFNRSWAAAAPVLMISVVKRAFDRNGQPNRCAEHDLGAASAQLTLQATALGLVVHQMAGIEHERCRSTYGIPAGWDPMAGLAVGYAGDPATLSAEMRERELAPRTRKPQKDFVFAGAWGSPASR